MTKIRDLKSHILAAHRQNNVCLICLLKKEDAYKAIKLGINLGVVVNSFNVFAVNPAKKWDEYEAQAKKIIDSGQFESLCLAQKMK